MGVSLQQELELKGGVADEEKPLENRSSGSKVNCVTADRTQLLGNSMEKKKRSEVAHYVSDREGTGMYIQL